MPPVYNSWFPPPTPNLHPELEDLLIKSNLTIESITSSDLEILEDPTINLSLDKTEEDLDIIEESTDNKPTESTSSDQKGPSSLPPLISPSPSIIINTISPSPKDKIITKTTIKPIIEITDKNKGNKETESLQKINSIKQPILIKGKFKPIIRPHPKITSRPFYPNNVNLNSQVSIMKYYKYSVVLNSRFTNDNQYIQFRLHTLLKI